MTGSKILIGSLLVGQPYWFRPSSEAVQIIGLKSKFIKVMGEKDVNSKWTKKKNNQSS
jgi:hypothetical protein